jgi:hypothetical protein
VASPLRGATRARPRAESSPAACRAPRRNQERGVAPFACSFDGSPSVSTPHNPGFTWFQRPVACASPITTLTGRHDVVWAVVQGIAVQMVCYQVPRFASTDTLGPLDWCLAPEARVGTRADPGVEHSPCFAEFAALSCQRVTTVYNDSPRCAAWVDQRSVLAGTATESPDVAGRSSVDRPASVARPFHRDSVPRVQAWHR